MAVTTAILVSGLFVGFMLLQVVRALNQINNSLNRIAGELTQIAVAAHRYQN